MLLDLLRVVAQSLKPVKLFSQQLPTFLLFRDRRSVAQQCWIRLHSSSNIVGATMLGVVAPVCTQPKLVLILILQGAPLGLAVEMN